MLKEFGRIIAFKCFVSGFIGIDDYLLGFVGIGTKRCTDSRKFGKLVFMNHHTIQRVADADAACLAIVDDGGSFCRVGILVDIGMTNACARFNNRHFGSIAYEIDQTTRSARDDEINFTYCIEQLGSSGVIVWQQNAETFGKTRLTQYLMDDGHLTIV